MVVQLSTTLFNNIKIQLVIIIGQLGGIFINTMIVMACRRQLTKAPSMLATGHILFYNNGLNSLLLLTFSINLVCLLQPMVSMYFPCFAAGMTCTTCRCCLGIDRCEVMWVITVTATKTLVIGCHIRTTVASLWT